MCAKYLFCARKCAQSTYFAHASVRKHKLTARLFEIVIFDTSEKSDFTLVWTFAPERSEGEKAIRG